MMKYSAISSLLLITLFATGCTSLYTAAAVGSSMNQASSDEPYQDEPPEPALIDEAFEQQVLTAAQNQEDLIIDQRWTTVSTDWQVDRETDDFGNSTILGRFRLVWVGGPVKDEHLEEEAQRDCYFQLYQAYEEHMGGGNYGPTNFGLTVNWHPHIHRMRCDTDEDVAQATPAHYHGD